MGRDKAKGLYWKLNNRCTTCGRPAKQREDGTFYSVCEVCYNRAKYANERKAKGKKGAEKGKRHSLCWDCRNALPISARGTGCSWSRSLTPVEGWTAIPCQQIVNEYKTVTSYEVKKCPLFEKDPEREVKK